MSSKIEKLLSSVDQFEKIAVDIEQPISPKEDIYENWIKGNSFEEDADADTYIRTANYFEELAKNLLVEAKDKKEKKVDPKAKVRNRGTVCVPASSAKDKKDHFPINDADQARNALARVHQYDKAPPWYGGSLKSLQELVSRKVHSKYPSIGKEKSSKKSSFDVRELLLTKYAE